MDLIDELLLGNPLAVLAQPDGKLHSDAPCPDAILAGSFDPLHLGHLQLAAAATQLFEMEVHFELCLCNVDKPALSNEEIRSRLKQFAGKHPVWLTQTPTFVEKARLFPGAAFVVGVDTAERIIDSRYYLGSKSGLRKALDSIRESGCRFMVGGRRDSSGKFIQLADLAVPTQFHDLFVEIPQSLFQADISSTQLRETGSGDD